MSAKTARPKPLSLRYVVFFAAFFAGFIGLLSIDLSTFQLSHMKPPGGQNVDVLPRRTRANDVGTQRRRPRPIEQQEVIGEEVEDDEDDTLVDEHANHNHERHEPQMHEELDVSNPDDVDKSQEESGYGDESSFFPSSDDFATTVVARPQGSSSQSRNRRSFGVRNGYRLTHIKARQRLSPASGSTTRRKLANPVIEDVENDLIPFREEFVREAFRNTPRIEMEAEYFRFEDIFGLIDTGWDDDQVLFALQRLVDIYAQANIRIRLRKREALARVKLSRERSLAYWYYVDYPKAEKNISPFRMERKELMKKVIGPELIDLFGQIDKERQGLFDWIAGWPEERTPWENENVVGMYPSFYYFFMNGGGEDGCMRFRTGDCNTPKEIKGMNGLKVYCFHLDVIKREREVEVPIVRSWERYNFTADMAIRLVAHEMGHAMTLRHPNKGCVQVEDWPKGNLMSQVMTLAPPGRTCKVSGWPSLAAKATYLTDDQIEMARKAVKKDLRETSVFAGCERVGKTVEVPPTSCEFRRYTIKGFYGVSVPAPSDGTVRRVRWKSTQDFTREDKLKISTGKFNRETSTWEQTSFEIVRPHTMGGAVHQEHDVDLHIRKGEFIAILLETGRSDAGLDPQTHTFEDPEALSVDVVGYIPKSRRHHPTVNQVMSSIDENTIFPETVPRASGVADAMILTQESGWIPAQRCAEWILNYDLQRD